MMQPVQASPLPTKDSRKQQWERPFCSIISVQGTEGGAVGAPIENGSYHFTS